MITLKMSGLAYRAISNHIEDIIRDYPKRKEFAASINNFTSKKRGKGYVLTFNFESVEDAELWIGHIAGHGEIAFWTNSQNSDIDSVTMRELKAAWRDSQSMKKELNNQAQNYRYRVAGLQHPG